MKPEEHFVKSGEIRISTHSAVLETVVGSCVALCLFDPQEKVGGMNHFLLPYSKENHPEGPLGRFANLGIKELIRRLECSGACRKCLVAKLAGGASILSISTHNHIPQENVKAARQILSRLSIPIVSQDCGGSRGRKVVFDTGSGHVTINDEKLI